MQSRGKRGAATPLNIRAPRHLIRVGRQEFPFLRSVERAEAAAALAEYVAEARSGPIIVTVRGRPVAFLARVKGIDLEDLSMGTDPRFLGMLARARRELARPAARTRKTPPKR